MSISYDRRWGKKSGYGRHVRSLNIRAQVLELSENYLNVHSQKLHNMIFDMIVCVP